MKRLVMIMVMALLLALAACGGAETADGGASAATCPTPGEDTLLYTDEDLGYCVLYPSTHQVMETSESDTAFVVDSLLDVSNPRVYVNVTDAAGQDTESAAAAALAAFGLPDMSSPSNIILSGADAVVLDNLPGQDINRRVIIVHEGRLYDLMFTPIGPDYGELGVQTETVYRTFVDSFTFLP